MNGLKYIRTRCNYSQRALAEHMNVSRQAVNMWENNKKSLSSERKQELCKIFGLDNPDWFGEISEDTKNKLKAMPLFKISVDSQSEKFSFKDIERDDNYNHSLFLKKDDTQTSLDEKCALRRLELKQIFDDITDFAEISETHNSYDNLTSLYRINKLFGNALDLYKEAFRKYPECVMIYYNIIMAVMDALNISFGLVEKKGFTNQINDHARKIYDCTDFSLEASDVITKQLDKICSDISKREDLPGNYRRR